MTGRPKYIAWINGASTCSAMTAEESERKADLERVRKNLSRLGFVQDAETHEWIAPKGTRFNRCDLDESDTTARQCEDCGRWTVFPVTVWIGEECAAFCPHCAKVSP